MLNEKGFPVGTESPRCRELLNAEKGIQPVSGFAQTMGGSNPKTCPVLFADGLRSFSCLSFRRALFRPLRAAGACLRPPPELLRCRAGMLPDEPRYGSLASIDFHAHRSSEPLQKENAASGISTRGVSWIAPV